MLEKREDVSIPAEIVCSPKKMVVVVSVFFRKRKKNVFLIIFLLLLCVRFGMFLKRVKTEEMERNTNSCHSYKQNET